MSKRNHEQAVKKQQVVLITGTIGSGKSEVCKILLGRGYPVYAFDMRAKELAATDLKLKRAIIKFLGKGAYDKEGAYNIDFVRENIFGEKAAIGAAKDFGDIFAPYLKADFANWVSEQKGKIVFCEMAAMNHEKSYYGIGHRIYVSAEKGIRLNRIIIRNPNIGQEEIKRVMDLQSKIVYASSRDKIILNQGSKKDLKLAVDRVLNSIRKSFEK